MQSISANDFKENFSALSLLDIRTPRERADFDLGGIHIPLDDLLARINELNPTVLYTVICYNGTQSQIACRLLTAKGYQAQNVTGGLEAYLSLP
ncbi:rhodanese-like domain-containing protein [Aquirufa regiilacus]